MSKMDDLMDKVIDAGKYDASYTGEKYTKDTGKSEQQTRRTALKELTQQAQQMGFYNADKDASVEEEFRRVKSELMRMVSATCDCADDVGLGGYEGKDQTVLEIPDSVELRYNAPGAPKRETVCIDTCLVPEIKLLWSLGIVLRILMKEILEYS